MPEDKCRKTQIVRIYDPSGKYWVDVECLGNASFVTAQWSGPLSGNQSEEAVVKLTCKTADGCEDTMLLGVSPDQPITGQQQGQGSSGGQPPEVPLPARASTVFESRHRVREIFKNDRKALDCCKGTRQRIKFNDVEDLVDKMPPSDPAKYKGVITGDGADIYLDVCVPQDTQYDRATTLRRQTVTQSNMWGKGNVALPGASGNTDQKGPHFRLDPYQVPINFGPDALAVEFFDGDGPPAEDPNKGVGGGAAPKAARATAEGLRIVELVFSK